jgi:hypothetical protein
MKANKTLLVELNEADLRVFRKTSAQMVCPSTAWPQADANMLRQLTGVAPPPPSTTAHDRHAGGSLPVPPGPELPPGPAVPPGPAIARRSNPALIMAGFEDDDEVVSGVPGVSRYPHTASSY